MTDLTKRILKALAGVVLTTASQLLGKKDKSPPGPESSDARKSTKQKKQT